MTDKEKKKRDPYKESLDEKVFKSRLSDEDLSGLDSIVTSFSSSSSLLSTYITN